MREANVKSHLSNHVSLSLFLYLSFYIAWLQLMIISIIIDRLYRIRDDKRYLSTSKKRWSTFMKENIYKIYFGF